MPVRPRSPEGTSEHRAEKASRSQALLGEHGTHRGKATAAGMEASGVWTGKPTPGSDSSESSELGCGWGSNPKAVGLGQEGRGHGAPSLSPSPGLLATGP